MKWLLKNAAERGEDAIDDATFPFHLQWSIKCNNFLLFLFNLVILIIRIFFTKTNIFNIVPCVILMRSFL